MKISAILFNQFINKYIRFSKPVQIFCSKSIDDVPSVFSEISKLINDGYCAAGFVSYEAAPAFDDALQVKQSNHFPFCWFAVFNTYEIVDPLQTKNVHYEIRPWKPAIDEGKYRGDIRTIKWQLREGYTYQVNYTYRLHSHFKGDPYSLFCDLIENQTTQNSAYIDTGDFVLCSASPELFFKLDGAQIECRPMKGTAPRGRYYEEDEQYKSWLHHSGKNRAENAMIVDMIRNDLGRIAEIGTVRVQSLYEIERYQTALQMTSTVTAETNVSLWEIFSAMFPCASITGAPKAQTMKIISELETTPRNIYTGTTGFVLPERKAQFNVAIRTVMIDRKNSTAEYGVGGGIVWESDEREEFQETQIKSKILFERQPQFQLLETILWIPEDGYFLLEYHMKRIKASAAYFDFHFSESDIRENLESLVSKYTNEAHKIRLLVSKEGKFSTKITRIDIRKSSRPVHLKISNVRVESSDPLLFHKTTHRNIFNKAKQMCGATCDDVVLVNERGEITETSIFNIVVNSNGNMLTPARDCGLLAGTFREWLIDQNRIKEAVLTPGDIEQCREIFVINSVRKWQRAILIDK
ncbi:aminodeoxychorismate synthase component I [candidate division KSB1 bacterium]|nr:aminodeoxychorismate synthase component I [candidate division KSB1 bacterium]